MKKICYILGSIIYRMANHIIMHRPISFLFFLLFFFDFQFILGVLVFSILENCIYETNYYILQRKSVNKFMVSFCEKRKGIKELNSEIVHKYRKTAIKLESNPFLDYFPPEILIYKLPPISKGNYTFPIYYRSGYIFLKSSFEENEIIDRGLLAHELGHAFHSKYRNSYYLMPINILLLQLFMLLYAIFFQYWIPFLLILSSGFYLSFIGFFRYNSHIETEADLRALKIVELCEGIYNMHVFAKNLIKLRIQECRANGSKPELIHSILGFSHFVSPKDRYQLLRESFDESIKYNHNPYICEKEKKRRNKFEYKLRTIIEKNQYYESVLTFKYHRHWLYVFCLLLAVYGTAIAFLITYNTSLLYVLLKFYDVLLISFIVFIIIQLLYLYIKSRLWKKMDYFLARTGI